MSRTTTTKSSNGTMLTMSIVVLLLFTGLYGMFVTSNEAYATVEGQQTASQLEEQIAELETEYVVALQDIQSDKTVGVKEVAHVDDMSYVSIGGNTYSMLR